MDLKTKPDVPDYGRFRATLHWALALAIIAMMVLGFLVMLPMAESDPAKVPVVRAHMIIGLTIAAMLLFSIPLAYLRRGPPALTSGRPGLDRLASVTHHALRLTCVVIVVSGIATSAIAGVPDVVFGGMADRLPAGLQNFTAFRVHVLAASLLLLLVSLHVAGALFHALVRRDGIFRRMSVFRRA